MNTHSLDLEASSSQYASISDASQTGLDITGDMTIEAYCKFESLPSNEQMMIVSKYQTAGDDRAYRFFIDDSSGTKSLRLGVSSDGTSANTVTASVNYAFTTGVWYHLAGVVDTSNTDMLLYVNGSPIGTETSGVASIHNSADAFVVGQRTGESTEYFDGLIDEVRVWNDVRTATEIQDNLGTELIGNEANLVGYWKFNNNYLDETSNNNDLTATNSPVFSTDVPFDGSETSISDSTTLTTNLVSYWKLDEESGTRSDAHGSNDLTDNNTVLYGTGIIGNGADFEADNTESLSITDASQTGLDFSADLTFSAWINFETLPASAARSNILGKTDPTGNQRAYGWGITEDTGNYKITFYTYDDGNTPAVVAHSGTFSMSTSTLYHVAVTKDGANVVFYLNGANVGTGTVDATIYDGTAPFAIGLERPGNASELFDGIIDEVGAWSRVLTAGEVSNLYNAGSGLAYSATNYTLTADAGSYTLTGQDANLLRGLKMVAAAGSYVLTGIDVAFSKGYGMVAEAGSYTLTGIDATLTAARKLVAAAGSYTLTGVSATLSRGYKLIAAAGSYILTGFSIKNVWAREDKSDDPTWTNSDKNSSTWTNQNQS